jgi:hypothetical protein
MMWFGGKSDPMGVVENALKARSWKYVRSDDATVMTGVHLPSGWFCGIAARNEAARKTVLFIFSPIKESEAAVQAMSAGRIPFFKLHPAAGHTAEQVAGACALLMFRNYRMLLGNFERDHTDGEVRFRVALPYRDTTLTLDQVHWCMEIALESLVVTLPRLEGFLNGSLSLEAAMGEASAPMVV